MYLLLLLVFAAISAAVANPVPADEAHREKPLSFSLGKDNPPSTAYHDFVQHEQTLSDADSYGTTLNKHQIPSGVTSEYPVGDMHLPLQATKALNPAIINALQETSLHIPKEAHMDDAWRHPWKNADDEAQSDSKCGGSKSVCCMKGWTQDISVVKTCRHEKPRRLFQWGSHCQDPQYYDFCDELWALIDDRNSRTDDISDRRKVILKDGRPMVMARKVKSQGITCYSDCKRPNPPTKVT